MLVRYLGKLVQFHVLWYLKHRVLLVLRALFRCLLPDELARLFAWLLEEWRVWLRDEFPWPVLPMW